MNLNIRDYILPFLFGGFLVAFIKYFGQSGSPMAPILGALPIGLLTSYLIVERMKNKKYISGYIKMLINNMIAAIFIFIVYSYWLTREDVHSTHRLMIYVTSFSMWLLVSLAIGKHIL